MSARRCLLATLALLGASATRTLPVRADGSDAAAREDQVLVQPNEGASLSSLLDSLGSTDLGAVGGSEWHAVSVPYATAAADFVATLSDDTSVVASAQLDYEYAPTGSTLPAGGEELSASEIPGQSELDRIGAPAGRARASGAGVRIAVVDSGILADLAGVSGNVDDGYNAIENDTDPKERCDGIDNDSDGLVDEMHGHGTFVSSLIVAIAPDVRIVPIRAIDADGCTSSSLLAGAIAHALDIGVDAIHLSVAVGSNDAILRSAVHMALSQGVPVISAAGNASADIGAAPSTIESMLVATAVDSDDVLADFASYGEAVDVSAPGIDLLGSYPGWQGTAIWSGTSFSAALVSGAFALVKERHSDWSLADLASRIKSTSDAIDSVNSSSFAGKLGSGRLDLDAATDD